MFVFILLLHTVLVFVIVSYYIFMPTMLRYFIAPTSRMGTLKFREPKEFTQGRVTSMLKGQVSNPGRGTRLPVLPEHRARSDF